MRGTIFRQTMFAEFEKTIHELAEAERAAHRRPVQERLPRVARALLRARFHARRRAGAGVLSHPAFLSGVLRLQVRHGHVGRDGPGRSRHRRRAEGAGRLPRLPRRRLLERPAGPACATRASTWNSPRPSTPPWSNSAGWSRNSTRCCEIGTRTVRSWRNELTVTARSLRSGTMGLPGGRFCGTLVGVAGSPATRYDFCMVTGRIGQTRRTSGDVP